MIWFLFGVEVTAACVVVWHVVDKFNRMSTCTALHVMAAWAMAGAAAMGVIGELMGGRVVVDWQSALMMLALAMISSSDLCNTGRR